jgi:aspartyl-tRNA(Asn)/glutamyl-tRNA(Gln) amidotransferase subunit A
MTRWIRPARYSRPDYEAGSNAGVKGLRVGIPKEYRVDGAPAEIDALWAKGASG